MSKVPAGLTLFPFQEETVLRTISFLSLWQGAYVANEQGLGKTITALATINTMHLSPSIIICPAIMRLTWQDEIYKWCRFQSAIPKVLVGASTKDLLSAHLASYEFVIISYQLLAVKEVLAYLCKESWALLISDENHFCKSLKAKRTKALFQLSKHATYKLLMSGTPMSANVIDLFPPCHLLAPTVFPSFNLFAEHYSNCTELSVPVFRAGHTQTILVKKYYGLKNAHELSALIRKHFYIRYKKEEVLTELPPKIFQRITLPEDYAVNMQGKNAEKMAADVQTLYKAMHEGLPVPLQVATNFSELRRMQGEKKAHAVAEFTAEKLDENIPIVLFAYHKNVIASLVSLLSKYNPVVITGETTSHDRHKAIQDFQDGASNLFIGNFIAAGTGITLTRSSTVILAELDWVPNTLAQAIDRVHRIGQCNQVLVYYFIVKQSIDEHMDELIIRRAHEALSVV